MAKGLVKMQTQQRYYTPEEYLAQEEVAELRNEYRDGEIVPMTGGSINHNQIALNVSAFLKFALRGKNFKPYIGDLRLWIPSYRQYTYPDVLVIEGQPRFQKLTDQTQRTDTILNPCLIIEVLSKSTRNYDYTDKFRYYRSIADLREYVLINQYEVAIDHYVKADGDTWLFRAYESDAATLTFASVKVEMPLVEIYEGVDFSLNAVE
jgi:Uma2 family endonuclease